MSHLGAFLKAARERSGMSARTLSAEAGLSPAYVSRLESGNLEPSLRAFAKIVTILNLNEMEILFCLALEVMENDESKE